MFLLIYILDSQYLAKALPSLETVACINTSKLEIQQLFIQVQNYIHARSLPCFIGHIRAHTVLPGPLSLGNHLADVSTKFIALSKIDLARQSHQLHHQSSRTLRYQFQIPREAARQIVKQCSTCPQFSSVPHYGINPRGLLPNQLWQMDVTHVMEFGKQRYVHDVVDTFSGFILASAQTGEATKHVIAHCIYCFSILRVPQKIKTDNGSGYASKAFKLFCQQMHIVHITGIPYNPQGQGIVERAHGTLKVQLLKIIKGELYSSSPRNYLNHAIYILNFLQIDKHGHSAAERFWHPQGSPYTLVKWRDPLTGQWYGPDPILICARGYVCVFSQEHDGAQWLPERSVHHVDHPDKSTSNIMGQ
ncbi:Pol polyprotein [Fukomys damarensis]|uniref:RNA-directed DNA polymerase n=1 Tax=Fukomys damarensis TaxID=885580 RepID=A0A091DE02_FUKDA|nr:Pol polyprotein [Fukomys damarensis]